MNTLTQTLKRRQAVIMSRTSAIRAARTAATGAENAGRMDTYAAAEKMGIRIRRRWVAVKDGRTRHEHGMADGQTVEMGKPFIVGGEELMFPGDPSGSAANIYNCRCSMRTAEKDGIEAEPRMMRGKNAAGEYELVQDMTYKEWAGWKDSVAISTDAGYNISRNTAVGKPGAVIGGASLNRRQEKLLAMLSKAGDTVTVAKNSVGMRDLAALSAHEQVEFAMLTRKAERMIFRGTQTQVPAINGMTAKQYRDNGWKWSGHTHVASSGDLIPSDGDLKILSLFGQSKTVLYNAAGEWSIIKRR